MSRRSSRRQAPGQPRRGWCGIELLWPAGHLPHRLASVTRVRARMQSWVSGPVAITIGLPRCAVRRDVDHGVNRTRRTDLSEVALLLGAGPARSVPVTPSALRNPVAAVCLGPDLSVVIVGTGWPTSWADQKLVTMPAPRGSVVRARVPRSPPRTPGRRGAARCTSMCGARRTGRVASRRVLVRVGAGGRLGSGPG